MDPGPLSRTELRLACLHQVGGAKLPVERRGLLADFVDAYLPLTSEEEREYKILDRGKEAKVMFMTWSERTRAEGFREGKKEGARETLRKVLLRQLRRRFGPIPEPVKRQVEEMTSVPRLNGLLERVLTASSLKELGLLH